MVNRVGKSVKAWFWAVKYDGSVSGLVGLIATIIPSKTKSAPHFRERRPYIVINIRKAFIIDKDLCYLLSQDQ